MGPQNPPPLGYALVRSSGACRQGRRNYQYVFFWVRTHPLFRSWVRIGIGPTHFLRPIIYYCVCIQHDIDKSQISFIELWFSKHCFVTAEFKIFISPADYGVWIHPHFYTDLRPLPAYISLDQYLLPRLRQAAYVDRRETATDGHPSVTYTLHQIGYELVSLRCKC